VTEGGAVSVWHEMPSDMLGVILDQSDVAERIAGMLRMAAELIPTTSSVALSIGLHGLGLVVEGRASDLGHRTSASMPGFGQNKDALVNPRDTVPAGSIAHGANEIARELAARLILAFRDALRQ
jgi:hypothetical protein